MFQLPKKHGVKVNKICMYCGHVVEKVGPATINCPKCKQKGLRTICGIDEDGKPWTRREF